MAMRHHVQIALVLFRRLLLDAVDNAPRVSGQRRCFDRSPVLGLRRYGSRRDWGRHVGGMRLRAVAREIHGGLLWPWGGGRRCTVCTGRCDGRTSCRNPDSFGRDGVVPVRPRIGLADIGPAHQHGMRGRRDVLFRFLEVVVERNEIQRDAVGSQGREPAMPAARRLGLRIIKGHSGMRYRLENLANEFGQNPAWPDLDEPGDPVAGHRLDHLAEPHRLTHLIAELSRDIVAVRLGGHVRIHREARLPEFDLRQVLSQRRRTRGHDRRVERRGDRQSHRRPPRRLRGGRGPRDVGLMSGQHHLARCIVVGDHQRGGPLRFGVEHSPNVLGTGGDRQHRAILTLAGLGHQHAAHACGVDESVSRQDARGCQRADLAEAVARGGIGPHAQNLQQRQLGEAGGGDGRLGVVHRGERGPLRIFRSGVERRFWEHHPVQVGEITVDGVPHRECAGEGECEVGAHADVLAALAGEEEGRLAVAGRADADGDIGIGEALRGAVGERAAQPFGECLQRGGVRCD